MRKIEEATLLAHPDDDKTVCVFTDASDRFWSAVVTQIPPESIKNAFETDQHQPLLFASREFKGSKLKWSIIEKEAYPIMHLVENADYLLRRSQGFHLFTDHRNLCYIFDPFAHNPLCGKHTASRLERWAIRLMGLKYQIEFVPGDTNVFADLLTRWGAVPEVDTSENMKMMKRLISLQEEPSAIWKKSFEWPEEAEIRTVQDRAQDKESSQDQGNGMLRRTKKGKN